MADPVADGLIASLSDPGGNITGNTFIGPELGPKRLQLLREMPLRLRKRLGPHFDHTISASNARAFRTSLGGARCEHDRGRRRAGLRERAFVLPHDMGLDCFDDVEHRLFPHHSLQ
jgi:hypothetical protein